MSHHYEKKEYPEQRIKQRGGKDPDIIFRRTSYIPVSDNPKTKIIPQYKPYIGELEKQYLNKCIDDEWITGGKNVKEFEEKIAKLCGVKYSLATCNGTMALFVLLKACGIGKGDEVIVPDFTHVASANAVLLCGAKPVFCDVDETLCLDVDKIEVTNTTRAIMPIGIYGQSPDMDKILKFAKNHNIMVIQDSAQDLCVTWKDKPLCGYGFGSILSFYGDKLVSTAEGGMILTDNKDLINDCKLLVHHGSTQMGSYYHEHIGWNFRLSDVHAGIGLAQLDKLDEMVHSKVLTLFRYQTHLTDNKNIEFMQVNKDSNFIPFRIVIFVDNPGKLQAYLASLANNSIITRRVFFPLHLQPCYRSLRQKGNFANTIWAYEHGLTLPSYVALKDTEIEYICDKIKEFYA